MWQMSDYIHYLPDDEFNLEIKMAEMNEILPEFIRPNEAKPRELLLDVTLTAECGMRLEIFGAIDEAAYERLVAHLELINPPDESSSDA